MQNYGYEQFQVSTVHLYQNYTLQTNDHSEISVYIPMTGCKCLIIRFVDIFFFKNVFPCLDLSYSGEGRCQIHVIKWLHKPEEI